MTISTYATTAQAAEYLSVTPARVRFLCQDGKLAGAERSGRDWLIPWASVKKRKRAKKDKGGRPVKISKGTIANSGQKSRRKIK